MATVIDSLVVMLGLDASNYKKGRETAEKETGETARKSKEAADQITKSLTEVGRTIAGLFLGFESVTGFAKFLGGLNNSEAALGRTAAALGINVHELNKYELAARQAGQSGEDVAAAFQTLTAGQIKFLSGQGTSPIIDLLRLAGVAAVDSAGKIRNQGEVYEELAQKTAKWGTQIQAQRFRDAGISEGELKFLQQTQAIREEQYRTAEKNNSVDDDSVRKAQDLQKRWVEIKEAVESAGQEILVGITPYIRDAFEWAKNLMGAFKDQGGLTTLSNGFQVVGNIVSSIYNGWKLILGLLNDNVLFKGFDKYVNFFTGLLGKGLAFGADPNATGTVAHAVSQAATAATSGNYVGPKAGSLAARNNNPGNLEDKNGKFRKFSSMLEGQAALDSDIDAKISKGYDTIAKIIARYAPPSENNTAAYVDYVSKQLRKGANDKVSHYDTGALIQAITNYESGNRPNTGKNNAAGGAGNTTVQIDAIHVNAPQADPRAVAEQVPAAIQRRFSVTQAAQGQS